MGRAMAVVCDAELSISEALVFHDSSQARQRRFLLFSISSLFGLKQFVKHESLLSKALNSIQAAEGMHKLSLKKPHSKRFQSISRLNYAFEAIGVINILIRLLLWSKVCRLQVKVMTGLHNKGCNVQSHFEASKSQTESTKK